MRNVKEWRYMPYERQSAADNMAIDEYLVKYYKKTGRPVFRIYGWNPAAISVGKNQDVMKDINIENCTEDEICIVRRMTGGGAIFHANEITYSIVCSEADIGCKGLPVKESYERLNAFIIDFYKNLGLKTAFAKDSVKKAKFGEPASFCFSGLEEHDIVCSGKKLGGNAQARYKEIIFQHGSIPIEKEYEKAQKYFNCKINPDTFTSLEVLLKKREDASGFEKDLKKSFEKTFGIKLKEEKSVEKEKEAVDSLTLGKYSSDEWNLKGQKNEECC